MTEARPLDDARNLLKYSSTEIASIRELLRASFQERGTANEPDASAIQIKVKGVLENQRSALDYIAHELVEHFGTPGKRSSYPLAPDEDEFGRSVGRNLPGVGASRQDLVSLIESINRINLITNGLCTWAVRSTASSIGAWSRT